MTAGLAGDGPRRRSGPPPYPASILRRRSSSSVMPGIWRRDGERYSFGVAGDPDCESVSSSVFDSRAANRPWPENRRSCAIGRATAALPAPRSTVRQMRKQSTAAAARSARAQGRACASGRGRRWRAAGGQALQSSKHLQGRRHLGTRLRPGPAYITGRRPGLNALWNAGSGSLYRVAISNRRPTFDFLDQRLASASVRRPLGSAYRAPWHRA